MKTIELTEYQAKLVWCALNASQSQATKFLIQYESGMLEDSVELEDWYNEAKKEYNALKEVKEQLGWDSDE